jgi:hypothetical protein
MLLAAMSCYDGDHLGFVPCRESSECDAPPRTKARRGCLHPEGQSSSPGYCALPCVASEACAGEAPGDAAQDVICAGAGDAKPGYCALPCSSSQPCPTDMQCRSYAAAASTSCNDDSTCICFPVGDEGGE